MIKITGRYQASSLRSIGFQSYAYTDATREAYYRTALDLLRNALKVDKSTQLSRVSHSYVAARAHRYAASRSGDFNARRGDGR